MTLGDGYQILCNVALLAVGFLAMTPQGNHFGLRDRRTTRWHATFLSYRFRTGGPARPQRGKLSAAQHNAEVGCGRRLSKGLDKCGRRFWGVYDEVLSSEKSDKVRVVSARGEYKNPDESEIMRRESVVVQVELIREAYKRAFCHLPERQRLSVCQTG